MKRGFTLIEVTLALGILTTGVLAVVGLYAFGYRETRQSREDIVAAAAADIVLGQLTMAVSSTNFSWQTFSALENLPGDDGWATYFENRNSGRVVSDPTTKAEQVFGKVMQAAGMEGAFPSDMLRECGLKCGLIFLHDEGSPVATICFRAMHRSQDLLAVPMFYTEARYQGVRE